MSDLPPPSDRPLQIVVVENHPDSLEALVLLLTQLGHQVRSATTMAQALQALQDAETDVLISDIGLPDGDGWELLRRLAPPATLYAIAMSGYGMNADRDRSAAAGYRHHLVKPMDIEQLEGLLIEAAAERDRALM